MTLTQRTVLMKFFIENQFACCPLVWMFHDRVLNSKINHLQERSLKIVYIDSISSFDELLQKDHSFTIHDRKIECLAIELSKIKVLKILETKLEDENMRDVTVNSATILCQI